MRMLKWMVVVLAVLSLLAGHVGAQDFPKGQINYMNPFNPGGEVDIAIRAMQPYLEKSMGVPLVIQYFPAAGGALCWSKLAAVKPDG
jgi:tripartite-type tricarboxylate transporter receptor subunit TctC